MPTGHSISSGDRTEFVKYAKRSFYGSFNIFRADFGHFLLEMYYFKNIVVFYMDHSLLLLYLSAYFEFKEEIDQMHQKLFVLSIENCFRGCHL